MNEIRLDGTAWQTEGDVYDALLSALGAPSWHGRNLDALNDTLAGNDVNRIRQPLSIMISGMNVMSAEAREFVERLRQLAVELRFAGNEVDIVYQ